MESIKEMDQFLDALDPPKLNQMGINNLSKSITSNEIETIIKGLPTKIILRNR